jgi:hypothetical protein
VSEKRWFIYFNTDDKFVASGILYSLPYAFTERPINTDLFTANFSTLDSSKNQAKYLKKILFQPIVLI